MVDGADIGLNQPGFNLAASVNAEYLNDIPAKQGWILAKDKRRRRFARLEFDKRLLIFSDANCSELLLEIPLCDKTEIKFAEKKPPKSPSQIAQV